jgi:predicted nucleotidyltransferase
LGTQLQPEATEHFAVPPLILSSGREIAALCTRDAVRELALFGSVLGQDFASTSDVDVVAEFAPPTGISAARQYFDFKRDLESLLERSVDLVELVLRRRLKGRTDT